MTRFATSNLKWAMRATRPRHGRPVHGNDDVGGVKTCVIGISSWPLTVATFLCDHGIGVNAPRYVIV